MSVPQNAEHEVLNVLSEDEVLPRAKLGIGSILLITGVVLFALVILLALIRQQQTQPTHGQAPDFTITTYDGQPFRLSDQRGKVVVINFWASWCGPCRDEAPLLESLWQEYRDRGVVFVGVAYADLDSDSQAHLAEFGVTYPNGPDVGTVISKQQYHIVGVPETFVIDQEGAVQRFYFQLMPDPVVPSTPSADDDLYITVSDLRATLDELLAATPDELLGVTPTEPEGSGA
ncbi:MAG: TlpA disulfide reductase family protein [Anaerolineae bacterium]